MTAQNRKLRPTASPDYRPTEQELAAIRKLAQAKRAPRVKVSERDLVPDHPDRDTGYLLLMEAVGTADADFFMGFLTQLGNAGSFGREPNQQGINFMLSVVQGIEPRDQVEAMLAAQMAAVHMATMTFARRLAQVENIAQQDSAERAFSKLTRTFAAQMEALKRYRTGGEQKVTVQHVTVSEGGQAIVGNVTQSPREVTASEAVASPLPLAGAKTAPVPILDENKKRVPVPTARTSRKK